MVTTRLPVVRADILKFLTERDGTHTEIAEGARQCHSSVSLVLRDLHAEGLIHIGSYTKKSSRHRYVRTYRLGAGVDATMNGLDTAMQQNAAAVLALLQESDLTRRSVSEALQWSTSNTWNVILYLRDNNLIHVCEKITEPSGQRNVYKFRAGPGDDCAVLAPKRPLRERKPRKKKTPPPPLTDPLMAAFFGR